MASMSRNMGWDFLGFGCAKDRGNLKNSSLINFRLVFLSLNMWNEAKSVKSPCVEAQNPCPCSPCYIQNAPREGRRRRALRLQSPYTGVSTPPSPEIPKKSQKGVPGPPGPECQKSVEKVPDTDFVVFLTLVRVIWDFFDTFLTLRAGTPGNTFLRLLGISGPEALETPVYGGCNRKSCGETVVQEGVFGEPVFFSAPFKSALETTESMELIEKSVLSIFAFGSTISLCDAFSAPLAHPHMSSQQRCRAKSRFCSVFLRGGHSMLKSFEIGLKWTSSSQNERFDSLWSRQCYSRAKKRGF